MYGPKPAPPNDATKVVLQPAYTAIEVLSDGTQKKVSMPAQTLDDVVGPDVGKPPPALDGGELVPAQPLVPAPSSYPLSPSAIKLWLRRWRAVLGILGGGRPDGARPKFESPRLDGTPDGAWGYTVQCVATIEPVPGCLQEIWGTPSPPAVIAPHYDPFGGRPTQIDIPSPKEIAAMIGSLTPKEIARRGGLGTAMKNKGCPPQVDVSGGSVNVTIPDDCGGIGEICFFGIPLITIAAYIMFSIALVIIIALFPLSIFLKLKFCLPIGPKEP
jgi:hypothetical protein